MTKLFEWVYQNEKNKTWDIYINGKTYPSIKSREDAMVYAKDLANDLLTKQDCLIDLLLQKKDGSIELVDTYGKLGQ